MEKNIINTTISIMRTSGVLIAIGEAGKLEIGNCFFPLRRY